jgi:hypothetical protein
MSAARKRVAQKWALRWCGVGQVKGSPFDTKAEAEAVLARLDASARAAKQKTYGHYVIEPLPQPKRRAK